MPLRAPRQAGCRDAGRAPRGRAERGPPSGARHGGGAAGRGRRRPQSARGGQRAARRLRAPRTRRAATEGGRERAPCAGQRSPGCCSSSCCCSSCTSAKVGPARCGRSPSAPGSPGLSAAGEGASVLPARAPRDVRPRMPARPGALRGVWDLRRAGHARGLRPAGAGQALQAGECSPRAGDRSCHL